MRRRLALYLLACSLLALAGCKDPYGASAKAASTIAASIGTGLSTVQSLQANQTITTQEAIAVAGYLKYASDADGAFETCIGMAHNIPVAGVFTACANTFNTTLNNPTELALIHVSNTTASQTITTIIMGITTAVPILVTALGGS